MSSDALAALLKLVEDDRARRCRALLQEAEREGRSLCAQARREARARTHVAVVEERRRARRELEAARARLHTRLREQVFGASRAALDKAWAELESALIAHWQKPATREIWVRQTLEGAAAALPSGPWQIEHPPGWPDGEDLAAEVQRRTHIAPQRLANPALRAGLRLSSRNAVFDASVGEHGKGLLADRPAIEARLLILLHAGSP